MNKLLSAALAALFGLLAVSPAMAQVPQAYQAQVSNRVTNIPVTALNPLPVTAVLGSGSALAGKVGIDQTTPGATNAVVPTATTSGGLSVCRVVTGTTGFCKATPGQLFHVTVQNTNVAARYLHLYNKGSAPTLSTDTPIYTIPLALTSVREVDVTNLGVSFSTGIAWAVTTDDIAIPTTAGTSGDAHFTLSYK